MKKLISLFAAFLFAAGVSAQSVVLKAGTPVTVKSEKVVRAANVHVGENVDFLVANDVVVDGKTVIPYGTHASGVVTLAKKSSWWGTKGRLTVSLQEIQLADGTSIALDGTNVCIVGENRTPTAVVAFLFVWPCCFIPGTRAEMPAGYTAHVRTVGDVTIPVK